MQPNERTRESVQTHGLTIGIPGPTAERLRTEPDNFEKPVDVKAAAEFLGVSASLVYAYVERKQIPHFRMMGRAIRFRLSELNSWRQQFHVNGGING
jgi:excisionase family DNA binding protein